MSLKRLNINRNLIPNILSENVSILEVLEEKGINELHFRGEMPNGDKVFLIFFFNSDGTTSISPRNPNLERGKDLANVIAQNCVYSDKKNISLFIPLEKDDFDTILEYLQSDCNAQIIETKNIPGGVQKKLSGSCGNQLVLKYFTRKANLQVQGKPLSLYEDLIDILCELLPYEKFVSSQLKQIDVNLAPSVVKGELESRLPMSYNFLGEKVQAIISPSLALNKLGIELDDYTSIAMPVLRGLEGYLKRIFSTNGFSIDKTFGSVIDGSNDTPRVKQTVKASINCDKTVNAIEKCYTYWKQQRHGLFHVDANVETTRVLNQNEAHNIIEETLNLIENTYTVIPN